ncbi:MAG: ABC transporter substrate-binding protein [Pseudomonadota bacterium]
MGHDDMQKKMLGGATRREFLAGATALGVAATATPGLLGVAQAADPKKGGHLRAGLLGGAVSDRINPTTYNDTVMISINRAIRDSLVEVGQDNTAQPGLATSWEPSDDAATWYFELRKGVEFSNGKSLTTEDVIESINAHRGDTNSAAKALFAGITDVKADGDNRIVISLSSGNSDFPFLLTDYHLAVGPVVEGKLDLDSGMGTGLYILEEFEPGIRATMKRNPNAWQLDDGFGFVDSAEVVVIQDTAARQSSLFTNDVDVINKPDLKTAHLTKRKPGVRIEAVDSNQHYTAPMRSKVAPYDDLNVRMAIKHSLDRDEFIAKILFGYGTVGNDHPIGPGFQFHAGDIPQNTYDPEKAKWYLKQAGLSSLDVTYHAADTAYAGAVDGGVLFSEHAKASGINLTVKREPNDGYWSTVWNKVPFCACIWGSRPVEDMILSICYQSDAQWNDSQIDLPRLDAVIRDARAELNENKRRELYREAQMLISQQGGTIVPAFTKDVMALSDRVGTTNQYGGGWEMDGGHFIKRWWLV